MCKSDEEKFKEIIKSLNKKDSEFLNLAYNFSKKAHKWQKRKSWEEYFIHPLAVALSLWDRFKDLELTVAGFLHDTVEDCDEVSMEDIYKTFWKNVWFMVDSITKWENKFHFEDETIEDIRDKMIAGWMKNIWCILLKLADREHNLATLHHMPAHKQIKKSFESQSLYIPLMHILWFNEKKCLDISECNTLFQNYLKENNLTGYKQIKNHLLNICFKDFNEELFDVVYNNSTNVVWELENKVLYKELLEQKWFMESVNVKSISVKLNKFIVLFSFKNWFTTKNISNLSVGKYYNY